MSLHPHQNTFSRRNAGFSLIEILVAMVIIGVLAMLIISVMGNAVEKSHQVSCRVQLRQVYTVMELYMNDHHGRFPPGAAPLPESVGYTLEWRGVWYAPVTNPLSGLPGYVDGGLDEMKRMVICPKNAQRNSQANAYNEFGFPYVCNYEIMTQSGAARVPPRREDMDASRTVLLADSAMASKWGLGVTAISIDREAKSRLENRHGEQMNVIWADGHITAEVQEKLQRKDFEVYKH